MKCQVPVPIMFFFFIYLQFISQKLDSQIRGDENNQKNIINIKNSLTFFVIRIQKIIFWGGD